MTDDSLVAEAVGENREVVAEMVSVTLTELDMLTVDDCRSLEFECEIVGELDSVRDTLGGAPVLDAVPVNALDAVLDGLSSHIVAVEEAVAVSVPVHVEDIVTGP